MGENNGRLLDGDEREALRDRMAQVLAVAAGLYTRIIDDAGTLSRAEVVTQLSRLDRHRQAAGALISGTRDPDGSGNGS